MMEAYGQLLAAAAVFLATHIGLASYASRTALIAKFGQRGYLIGYVIVSFVTFGALLFSFADAPREYLWLAPTWVRHLPMGVMIIVCILIVAGYMGPNPTAVGLDRLAKLDEGPKGIFRVTRHPILSGIVLWALVHIPASGQLSAIILQASIALLAIMGMMQIDRRKARTLGEEWQAYAAQTSAVPFAAILAKRQRFVFSEIGGLPIIGGAGLYFILISAHRHIIGVSPLPMP